MKCIIYLLVVFSILGMGLMFPNPQNSLNPESSSLDLNGWAYQPSNTDVQNGSSLDLSGWSYQPSNTDVNP
ncbi:hypothetical protein IIV31_175L [Armadillidium vulgare iridescent virus]|uniref:Uncharacterized protein n=1 Tax=Armadillidium vulgare iridescent virus TaxID=72201 RepID=A0A068QKN8_9VIRU|nr:hypothetical protein IIV31_175L [Armadillidium vulgare iridescent virus]CCV02547.1 hypothetical protein IIV31_175L [Armadillidium vulgare iridescent virus]